MYCEASACNLRTGACSPSLCTSSAPARRVACAGGACASRVAMIYRYEFSCGSNIAIYMIVSVCVCMCMWHFSCSYSVQVQAVCASHAHMMHR